MFIQGGGGSRGRSRALRRGGRCSGRGDCWKRHSSRPVKTQVPFSGPSLQLRRHIICLDIASIPSTESLDIIIPPPPIFFSDERIAYLQPPGYSNLQSRLASFPDNVPERTQPTWQPPVKADWTCNRGRDYYQSNRHPFTFIHKSQQALCIVHETSTRRCHFLGLPAEIRNRVFHYCLHMARICAMCNTKHTFAINMTAL